MSINIDPAADFRDPIMQNDSIIRTPCKLPGCGHVYDLGTLTNYIFTSHHWDCSLCRRAFTDIKIIQHGEENDLIARIKRFMRFNFSDEYVSHAQDSTYSRNKLQIFQLAQNNNYVITKEQLITIFHSLEVSSEKQSEWLEKNFPPKNIDSFYEMILHFFDFLLFEIKYFFKSLFTCRTY